MDEWGNECRAVTEGEIQLFRTLWQNSSDNMFIVLRDASGEYFSERTNRAQEKTLGLQPNQLDGCRLKALLDEATYCKLVERYEACIHSMQPVSYEEKHEIDDQGVRYWNTMILPVIDEETGLARIFGVSREITALKQAKLVLQDANTQLELEVAKRTKELYDALKAMERISTVDKLTQLYNRHRLDEVLSKELNLSERYASQFGVVLLDLDDLKKINDHYGHNSGDEALKTFADILQRYSRKTDTVGRWGGDEFLIVAPHATKETLLTFANLLQDKIQAVSLPEVGRNLSASVGVGLYRDGDTVEKLIARTDRALYCSKQSGKNRVFFEVAD